MLFFLSQKRPGKLCDASTFGFTTGENAVRLKFSPRRSGRICDTSTFGFKTGEMLPNFLKELREIYDASTLGFETGGHAAHFFQNIQG